MRNLKKHLCLFICVMLCMSVLSAGIFTVQAAGEPEISVSGGVATLSYGGVDKVNKMYVGYSATDPGNITTWTKYQETFPGRGCFGTPADGYKYQMENVGYYVFLVNYAVGSRHYDAYIKVQNQKEPEAAPGTPEVALTSGTNKAVLTFGEAYTINKMYYGYIGTTETPYTNYVDYTETAEDKVRVTGLTTGDNFELSKIGYYRFIVNYTDANGKGYDAVYTLKNEVGTPVPLVEVGANAATLNYNGVGAVNKVYVAYFGTEDPGTVADWAKFTTAVKRVCTTTPADGTKFDLNSAGYYYILVNYTNGSKTVDAYYSAHVAADYVETIVAPIVSNVADSNNAVIDFNGVATVNRVYYGYIGTETSEYVDYTHYTANAIDRVVDVSAVNGKTYTMTKIGFYRFIVNYTDANGKNRDAVYTIENTFEAAVEGIPVVNISEGIATLDYNTAGTVVKMYIGYMGATNPGTIADWGTYVAARQTNTGVMAPADGYEYLIKGDAGFYTFVVNYTSNGVNKDVYYTFDIANPLDENYGVPYVEQTEEGAKDVVLYVNNAAQMNRVYYGYIGNEFTEYVDYEDYVATATQRRVDATPTEGEKYTLGRYGYYRFIINYTDVKGKGHDAVYTLYVDKSEEEMTSDEIYDNLEYIISDMEEFEELGELHLDEKGQEVYDILVEAVNEVYALKADDFVVTTEYVRSTYSAEVSRIAEIVKSMTTEERAAFEVEMGKFNTGAANALINIFDIDVNFGK